MGTPESMFSDPREPQAQWNARRFVPFLLEVFADCVCVARHARSTACIASLQPWMAFVCALLRPLVREASSICWRVLAQTWASRRIQERRAMASTSGFTLRTESLSQRCCMKLGRDCAQHDDMAPLALTLLAFSSKVRPIAGAVSNWVMCFKNLAWPFLQVNHRCHAHGIVVQCKI